MAEMENLQSFGQEKQSKPPAIEPPLSLDDFQDTPELRKLLVQIPIELRSRHMSHIEDLDDKEAAEYLRDILAKRETASRESLVSEPSLKNYFDAHSQEIWHALETDVFTATNNRLGKGQTARIKRFALNEIAPKSPVDSLAIKYLVTPTYKTLSVSGEHDLIREVERIQKIEEAEMASVDPTQLIRVPHPYFYYRNDKIQCYGMEEIHGIDLDDRNNELSQRPELKERYRETLAGLDREALMAEVDRFFDTMHVICLHGDVKPANIMVSATGQFYVIDFGQSVLANDIDEKSGPAFENLKDEEKLNAKQAIRSFLDGLNR